jgi:hypothetical protein
MKIYQQTPLKLIRVQIVKAGEPTQYITLYETTMGKVENMVKEIILKQNLSPFERGKVTQVLIREATGAINGKSKSVSFRGLSTQQVLGLVVDRLNKTKEIKIYQYTPTEYIRVEIAKLGEPDQYITLHETNREEVENMVRDIVLKQNLSPFEGGLKTQVMIREATGAINGKSKSLSFRGLGAKKMMDLIVNHINELNK